MNHPHVPPPTVLLIEFAPIRITHAIEFSPQTLASFTDRLDKLETNLVAFTDELLAKIADAKQATADEHTQVLAAIDALKAQLANVVSDSDKTAVFAAVDDLRAGIADVFTPDVPPAPAPTP